jgi:hypothetical protein
MKDLTQEYREKIFVGESRRTEENEPTLEDAFDDAWRQASGGGVEPGTRMHLLDTEAYGQNPINTYRVIVKVDI